MSEIRHDDILHWTKLNQNWNFMCAECHSTGLRKNYDAKADRFATTWAEISVGCEACHGQGSRHTAWAHDQQSWWPFGKREDPSKGLLVRFDERHDVAWPIDPQTGTARRSAAPATLRKEVETCGLCHARRAGFHEDWMPGQWLSQTHVVEALARNTYHPDGQIRDVEEPYNYTPFKQGRMFAAGVTCSDCHEPHSAKLRASGEGVCLQCHASDKYADAKHRHHASADPPPTCMSCHMQTRTYMIVDPRHDHTFRVPRPDLSVKLGTPNACNDCHSDKPAQWAAAAVEEWFGPNRKGFQTYGAAFHAARSDQADAAALLAVFAGDRNAPAVARASALSELASRLSPANIGTARTGLADPDPMVRIGALDMLENLPAARIWPLASPLLSDPVRGVRIRAASLLAAVPTAASLRPIARASSRRRRSLSPRNAPTPSGPRRELPWAISSPSADRQPTPRLNTRLRYGSARNTSRRRSIWPTSIGNSAGTPKGKSSFAGAYRRAARRCGPPRARPVIDEAEATGRGARRVSEGNRTGAGQCAIRLCLRGCAAFRRPRDEAMAVLKEALKNHPGDRAILSALVSFSRMAGDAEAALGYAEQLAVITPDDRSLAGLVLELRRAIKPSAQ